MDPFQILSHQLWKNVLNYIEDPNDKLNLIRTHSDLEKAFEDKKTEWLFPKVLRSLMGHFESKAVTGLKEAFLQCRVVSKAFCNAIDNYVKNYWNRDEYLSGPKNIPGITLSTLEQISGLISKTKDYSNINGRSPILRRDLNLTCNENSETTTLEPIISLLENVGQHLWHVNLFMTGFEDSARLARFICDVLELLPNTRGIKFHFGTLSNTDQHHREEELFTFPVPIRANLRKLTIAGHLQLPQCICFLPYFSQLTYLDINFQSWRKEYSVKGLFPNLKCLILKCIQVLHDLEQVEIFTLFMNLDSSNLERVFMIMEANSNYKKAKSNCLFLRRLGLHLLSKNLPGREWKSRTCVYNPRSSCKFMNVHLYDSNEVKLPPIKKKKKNLSTPSTHMEYLGERCNLV